MSKEIKKEAQDAELSLEDLTKIAGGTNSNTVDWGDPSKLPYTCPLQCNPHYTRRGCRSSYGSCIGCVTKNAAIVVGSRFRRSKIIRK